MFLFLLLVFKNKMKNCVKYAVNVHTFEEHSWNISIWQEPRTENVDSLKFKLFISKEKRRQFRGISRRSGVHINNHLISGNLVYSSRVSSAPCLSEKHNIISTFRILWIIIVMPLRSATCSGGFATNQLSDKVNFDSYKNVSK